MKASPSTLFLVRLHRDLRVQWSTYPPLRKPGAIRVFRDREAAVAFAASYAPLGFNPFTTGEYRFSIATTPSAEIVTVYGDTHGLTKEDEEDGWLFTVPVSDLVDWLEQEVGAPHVSLPERLDDMSNYDRDNQLKDAFVRWWDENQTGLTPEQSRLIWNRLVPDAVEIIEVET